MSRRGTTLSLAASAGGLLAAAFVSTAVASADIVDLFTPDTSTVDPTTGTEDWDDINLLDASQDVVDGFTTKGTVETFGSIVNNYATVTASTTGPEVGSHIDYLTIGGGFLNASEFVVYVPNGVNGVSSDILTIGGGYFNEFVYEPGVSPAITDLLITPFGDVTLLG
jgi:hypothetical protein